MKMSFRWYGQEDSISLQQIKQIPQMEEIVTALYNIPVGNIWPLEDLEKLRAEIEDAGLSFTVVESLNVHEDIKLGSINRDELLNNYCESMRNLSKIGVKTICYNFMPVFDWLRTDLAFELEDGSHALAYNHEDTERMNPLTSDLNLPGWNVSYTTEMVRDLMVKYEELGKEGLWENIEYFIKKVIDVAEEVGINLAIHPDDPSWSVFGLPRIMSKESDFDRFLGISSSKNHGITFCTGSLGCRTDNDLVRMISKYGQQGRIHFFHARNIKKIGEQSFYETAHPSNCGSVDMYTVLKALSETGFTGCIRPDHGRMIWGEQGKPGYGLFDRALGATYLVGLWEAIEKARQK